MKADQYWRSLGELAGDEKFLARARTEFADVETADRPPRSLNRRRFIQLAAASLTLASITSCRWEDEKIHAYAARPDGTAPGKPRYFASSLMLGGFALPVLVTSRDGRPNKIEGHPDHPLTRGASNVFMQAAMLGLCDPDRSRAPVRRDGRTALRGEWDRFFDEMRRELFGLEKSGGRGLVLLAEQTTSPSFERLEQQLLGRFPNARCVRYEPIDRDAEIEGARLAYGAPMRVRYDLARADRILTLDADLLDLHPEALRHARDWSGRRDPDGDMNRLYAVEADHGRTGAAADHRLPLAVHRMEAFLAHVEARIAGADGDDGLEPAVASFADAAVEDLVRHGQRSLVCVGRHLPASLHARAHRINARLGAVGSTLLLFEEPLRPAGRAALTELCGDMRRGDVDTLVMIGGNPVHDAPRALDFGGALASVRRSVHLSERDDETSRACTWHLPRAHRLEAWGDGLSFDGTPCLSQPLIDPLHGGRSELELLAGLLGAPSPDGREIVKDTWRRFGVEDEASFRRAVHDGFVTAREAGPVATPPLRDLELPRAFEPEDGYELVLRPDSSVYDGRFANNGWLQEVPDFMSKLTWDNALLMSPADAEAGGLTTGDVVAIEAAGRTLEAPIYVMPGHARGSLSLTFGYGRTEAGSIGGSLSERVDPCGFDAYELRPAEGGDVLQGVALRKTGRRHDLACTQDHHVIDDVGAAGREERLHALIREADKDEYDAHPDFAKHVVHHPPLESPFQEKSYDTGHRWGMAIDLNKCIGCNACTIACQSENNIPIVGKEEVAMGREMHWIRIDRYFRGDLDAPDVGHQPVACQHCENAPCEQVCPVAATVHSSEGLNDMVYNRCIGTRYCANNCPQKVRRFNYFNYNAAVEEERNEALKLAFNPEVTVRSRGVMEKCTFCVQRIAAARSTARNEKRGIREGDVVSACQQSCPSQAIVFGDLNDEESRVRAAHDSPRSYAMLEELNIKPRTLYLAGVKNPNPVLVGGGHK